MAPIVIGGLASATLAVGAARAVRWHRRRYSASHPGASARPTSKHRQDLHRQVLVHADEGSVDQLQGALRHLATSLAQLQALCRPRIIQHSERHLDVFLDRPVAAAPPSGWNASTADPLVWTMDPTIDLEPGEMSVAPLVITLGQPDSDGQLYLDLEAESTISLLGEPDTARDLARSIAMELLVRPPTDATEVIVVGDLLDQATAELDHVTLVPHWAEVENDITGWAEQTHQVLDANGWANGFVARGADPTHDVLSPLAVITTVAPPPAVLDALQRCRPATIAVIVLGPIDGPATIIDCRDGELTVPSLGLTCTAQGIGDQTAADLAHLVQDAEQPELPREEPSTAEEPLAHDAELDGEEPEYDILVRLLGDISVEGARKTVSPKPTAVIAYVALRRSVSSEQLQDACWSEPGLVDHRRRLRDLMSQCRAAIGASHLPTSSDGHYRAGPRLVTDVDLFERRVSRAAALPPAEAADAYRAALALVTGKVFSYPSRARSSYTWIDIENLINRWEVRIAGVAQQCAETYLDLGLPDEAIDALAKAGVALPLHSGLTETLMRAHAAAGNLHAVRSTFAAYVKALDDLHLDVEDSIQTTFDELTKAATGL